MCAKAGASLVLLARDVERGRLALEELEPLLKKGSHAVFHACDMADLSNVRRLGENLAKAHPKVDALVLNAGVLLPKRTVTDDGIEQAWATNVVGPWLLEQTLLDSLEAAAGRVVMVTSGGAYTERLSLPDADLSGSDYDGPAVYARTKRAQIALAQLHAERLAPRGIAVHAVHPGWADTPGVQSSLPTFRRFTAPLLRNADQGADTIAWLAVADSTELSSGLLWHDRRPRPRTRMLGHSETSAERQELEAEIARLAAR
jgi:NAD(P)-dependent dehydrogenase (short-subunit alcohol dehydrogenase family)